MKFLVWGSQSIPHTCSGPTSTTNHVPMFSYSHMRLIGPQLMTTVVVLITSGGKKYLTTQQISEKTHHACMVVAKSCCEGESVNKGLGNWSGLNRKLMLSNTPRFLRIICSCLPHSWRWAGGSPSSMTTTKNINLLSEKQHSGLRTERWISFSGKVLDLKLAENMWVDLKRAVHPDGQRMGKYFPV